MNPAILRLPEVKTQRGRSRSAHYRDIQDGLCTKPVRIGPRSVGWPENEIQAINEARIAGKSDDEIKDLVSELHRLRLVPAA